MQIRNRVWLSLIVVLLCGVGCAHRHRDLYKPEPIRFKKNVSSAQAGKIVRDALLNRNWRIVEEKPGSIVARVQVENLAAKIRVTYTAKEIKIDYVDSENLLYKKQGDKETIHSRYNRWLTFLEQDLYRAATQT